MDKLNLKSFLANPNKIKIEKPKKIAGVTINSIPMKRLMAQHIEGDLKRLNSLKSMEYSAIALERAGIKYTTKNKKEVEFTKIFNDTENLLTKHFDKDYINPENDISKKIKGTNKNPFLNKLISKYELMFAESDFAIPTPPKESVVEVPISNLFIDRYCQRLNALDKIFFYIVSLINSEVIKENSNASKSAFGSVFKGHNEFGNRLYQIIQPNRKIILDEREKMPTK